jgi:hypothetical protein
VGALLRWAVTWRPSGFDIQIAGLILVVVGIIGLAITVVAWFDGRGYAPPWRRVRYFDDDDYSPPVHDRVVREHIVREEGGPHERIVHERVVREYVPPPRDPGDHGGTWVDDDTVEHTADRTSEPTRPVRR